jgi:hypothetical protein
MFARSFPAVFSSVVLVFLFCSSYAVRAQSNTDAALQVNNLLKSFGKVPVTHWVQFYVPRPSGEGPVQQRFKYITTEFLGASNIAVVSSSPPQFDTPVITSLPTVPAGASWVWINCSAAALAGYSGTVSISEQRSVGISVSNGVTNTLSGQISFTFAPPKDYGGFGFGGQLSSSNSWTTTTVNQSSYQRQFTYQTTVEVNNFSKDHAVLAVTTVDQITLSIPFSATITVDADLSINDKGYTRLSQIFPDAATRTLSIKGTITEVDWANAQSSVKDIPFEPKDCQDQPGAVVTIAPPDRPKKHAPLILTH